MREDDIGTSQSILSASAHAPLASILLTGFLSPNAFLVAVSIVRLAAVKSR